MKTVKNYYKVVKKSVSKTKYLSRKKHENDSRKKKRRRKRMKMISIKRFLKNAEETTVSSVSTLAS